MRPDEISLIRSHRVGEGCGRYYALGTLSPTAGSTAAGRAAATLLATRGLTTALLAAGRLATTLRLPARLLPTLGLPALGLAT